MISLKETFKEKELALIVAQIAREVKETLEDRPFVKSSKVESSADVFLRDWFIKNVSSIPREIKNIFFRTINIRKFIQRYL